MQRVNDEAERPIDISVTGSRRRDRDGDTGDKQQNLWDASTRAPMGKREGERGDDRSEPSAREPYLTKVRMPNAGDREGVETLPQAGAVLLRRLERDSEDGDECEQRSAADQQAQQPAAEDRPGVIDHEHQTRCAAGTQQDQQQVEEADDREPVRDRERDPFRGKQLARDPSARTRLTDRERERTAYDMRVRRGHLPADGVGAIGQMWTERDRQRVADRMLDSAGIDTLAAAAVNTQRRVGAARSGRDRLIPDDGHLARLGVHNDPGGRGGSDHVGVRAGDRRDQQQRDDRSHRQRDRPSSKGAAHAAADLRLTRAGAAS